MDPGGLDAVHHRGDLDCLHAACRTRFGRAPEAVQLVVEEQLMPCRMSSLLTPTNRVAFGVMLKPVPVMSKPTECGPAPPYPGTAGDPVGWMAVIVGCASAGAAHRVNTGSVRSLTSNRIVFGTSLRWGRSRLSPKPPQHAVMTPPPGQFPRIFLGRGY